MALIKCSECGADVSEKASMCVKCGCPLDITKQHISDARKNKNKKIIMAVLFFLAIIIVSFVVFLMARNYKSPGETAIRLVKKDFGKNLDVESVYYNSKVNGCIVKFSVNGERDTATVHLEDKTVGYESIMDEYTEKSNNAVTEKEKKQYSQQAVEYMDLYDILWKYQLIVGGSEEDEWEKIK